MAALSKYKTYPEYKDSGVMLLDKIPHHWNLLRYKNILSIFQGMAFKSDSYTDDSNVLNVRMGNIKKGGTVDLTHNIKYLPNDYKNIFKEYRLYAGDIIIAMTDMSPSLDFLAVPAVLEYLDNDKVYLLNQRVGKLIIATNFNTSFIKYSLLDDSLKHQLKIKGLGTVQSNMSSEDLYSSYLSIPSFSEQTKIAQFLDHETAKIDQLIEKQQTLIELLKEKRQAVISHAVTKGLDPNVKMKDPGVEWLGEVPEHWITASLKWISAIYAGGTPSKDKITYWENGTIPWINSGEVNQKLITSPSTFITEQALRNSSAKWIPKHSLVMALAGQGKTKGTVAQLGIATTCNQSMAAIVPNNIDARFLYWWLERNYQNIRNLSGGDLRDGLNLDILGNIKCPLPTISEQIQIAHYIDKENFKINQLIEKSNIQIELMKERKTALISAAVTGKIDVRDWQPEQ